MFEFAGNRHWLTIAGCILAGLSTILSMIPFVCIWFVIRDILHAMMQGNISLAASSGHYAWLAVAFSMLSIFLYFVALCCSHLAAFRTATNMKKEAMHHIVTLPLGYFSQNVSGRLRKIIDECWTDRRVSGTPVTGSNWCSCYAGCSYHFVVCL